MFVDFDRIGIGIICGSHNVIGNPWRIGVDESMPQRLFAHIVGAGIAEGIASRTLDVGVDFQPTRQGMRPDESVLVRHANVTRLPRHHTQHIAGVGIQGMTIDTHIVDGGYRTTEGQQRGALDLYFTER